MKKSKLTRRDYLLLRAAVSEAAGWRGALVGNPDPVPLAQFDARIKETRRALAKLRPLCK